MVENVIIIGGGPAGLSAAIYLARAGLKPLVFAGSPPGGQLTLTSEVENYPGYESILGAELIEKMRNQAKKFGARIVDENVVKVDFLSSPKKLDTVFFADFTLKGPKSFAQKKYLHFLAKSVIISTGAKALWLNLPSEQRLRGHGVSACATCDGFFFRDKTVAVVGGGDTALEEALTLTKFAKKVYIIHRRDFFRASKIMQDRVFANKKIEIILSTAVEEIIGEKKVERIKIRNVGVGHDRPVQKELDGVFIAIGHKPDTEIFKDQIKLDEKGYIVTSGESSFYRSATSVPGVFAAGDCVDHIYQQAATAVGMGVGAALEVERYLNEAR